MAGRVHQVEEPCPAVGPVHFRRTVWALMVMPRSRSRSMLSRTCCVISRSVSPPVCWISRSASVDLPVVDMGDDRKIADLRDVGRGIGHLGRAAGKSGRRAGRGS